MNANWMNKVVRAAGILLVLGMLVALTAGTASASAGDPPPIIIDLGSGYWLVDGKIMTEKDLASAGWVPVTGVEVSEKIDIGSGYWLVDGKVVSEKELIGMAFVPVTGLRAPVNSIDIGSGCWLVKGPDGWQLITEED